MKLVSRKKGQIESLVYVIVVLFIIGVFLFFTNHLENKVWNSFDKYFNETTKYNESEARDTINAVQDVENSYYDYIFLAAFIGFIIQMAFLSYATRINIAFFWIFVIVGGAGLFAGIGLSNIWQEMAANPEFTETITRFPITNALIGTYYPTVITGVILVILLFTFGKPGESG